MNNITLIQLPLPIENETIEIPLTQNYTTTIDAIDCDLLEYKWHHEVGDSTIYAKRTGKRINGKQKTIRMHIVILERVLGRVLAKGEMVDHADSNGLNNRRNNLRLATQPQNARNKRKPVTNKSGYKGVSWYKNLNKWVATISFQSKKRFLGYFDNPEEAHEAYKNAAVKYHGEFARFE